jgi:uncharacterized protein YlxW (UPF0749 family)
MSLSEVPRPAEAGRAERRPGQVAIALTVALLGFLLATQLQAGQGLARRLAGEREADLAQLLSDQQTRSDRLLAEIVDLKVRLATAAGSQEQERILLEAARNQLSTLRVLLGLVPVRGEGIRMTIKDPREVVGADLLVDTVQELRDAGAEAIDVNGVRIVASTAFTGRPGALSAGDVPVGAPYVVTAIGARQTLAEGVRIPGGLVDSVEALEGASVVVETVLQARITSLRPPPRFAYATRA